MEQYLIKLRSGATFLGERPWWFSFLEAQSSYLFRNLQGKDAPAMTNKEIIVIQMSATEYLIKQRR